MRARLLRTGVCGLLALGLLFGCSVSDREPTARESPLPATTTSPELDTPLAQSPSDAAGPEQSPSDAAGPGQSPAGVGTPATPTEGPSPSGTASPAASGSPAVGPLGSPGKLKTMILTDDDQENISKVQFPQDTGEIFLVFTVEDVAPGVILKSVWKSRDNPGFERIDSTQAAPGRRREALSVLRPREGWPLGHYRVTLFLGGELAGSTEFEVVRERQAAHVKQPAYAILTLDMNRRKPLDKFPRSCEQIMFIVATDHLQAGTPVKSVWIAEETDKLDPDELVDTSTMGAPGPDKDSLFFFTPPDGGFHPGRYRVDLYIQDQRIVSKPFRIE